MVCYYRSGNFSNFLPVYAIGVTRDTLSRLNSINATSMSFLPLLKFLPLLGIYGRYLGDGDLNADWCWLMLIDADWYWLMLIGPIISVLIDADGCWLMLNNADWCWLMIIDANWCSDKGQPGFLLSERTSGASLVILECWDIYKAFEFTCKFRHSIWWKMWLTGQDRQWGGQKMELNESSTRLFWCKYKSCNDFIVVFVNSFNTFDSLDKWE